MSYNGSNDVDAASTSDPESLEYLTQTWVNERAAPELLPYATDCIQHWTSLVEGRLERLNEPAKTPDESFIQMLQAMEVERIKFTLRSYLRIRLHKIETFALHLASSPAARACLSLAEDGYLERYYELLRTHYFESGLKYFPEALQSIDATEDGVDMVPKPQLDGAVIARVTEQLGDIQLPAMDDLIPLDKDGIYLIRYRSIRDLLADRSVVLL
ncbi:GINS complex subunit [Sorochytrium milnesiophthora]